jgi:4-amino-4-deoxy-L-arabinose transferase-like glycosyltransferase
VKTPLESASPLRRALLIFAGALLLRAGYLLLISRTACLDINLDPISDMEAFHRWALTIAGGDWLGRGDFHPFHPWQIAVATKQQWSLWYGHVFHQEPFYPYLVAAIYLLAPREPFSVIVVQMLLGAAGCALTYLAARRLAPEGAALAAGILAVFYGPYLYYESLLLRDSFLIPLSALLLWLIGEAVARADARDGTERRWWGGVGLTCGIFYLTKASILPFFLLLLAWRWLAARRGSPTGPGRWSTILLLAAGFTVALAPAVARNLWVGAPPMKITTRGPIELINGNNPWHGGIGWFDGNDRRVSVYAHDTLLRADGRLVPTALSLLRDWSARPLDLARLQMVKAAYLFAPFEMPNNASYSYFRVNSALLRHGTLSFFWISPLALAGLIESARRWRVFIPVYLFLGSGIAITVVFYVIARFRAPLMPAILVLAGLGLKSTLDYARRGRWRRFAVQGVMIGTALALNMATSYPDRDLIRPQDHLISIQGYRTRGWIDAAIQEVETARRSFADLTVFDKTAASLYESQGRLPEAAAALRSAIVKDPADAQALRDLARLNQPPSP